MSSGSNDATLLEEALAALVSRLLVSEPRVPSGTPLRLSTYIGLRVVGATGIEPVTFAEVE